MTASRHHGKKEKRGEGLWAGKTPHLAIQFNVARVVGKLKRDEGTEGASKTQKKEEATSELSQVQSGLLR